MQNMEEIGSGGFGKIYKLKSIDDDKYYALKIIKFSSSEK